MKIKNIHILIIANLLYLIPASLIFLKRSNVEFIAYEVIVIGLGLLFLNFHKKAYLKLHELWLFSVWGCMHLIGGLLVFPNGKVLYQQIVFDILNNGGGYVLLKMDQVIHFYGFGLVAFIMYRILKEKAPQASNLFVGVFATIIAIGFGALNEVVEFAIVLSTEFNGVGDLFNMGLDLIFNLAGAITGMLIQYFRLK